MIYLPNGCRCSELAVSPANWMGAKASLNDIWKISYYFYDGEERKQVVIQKGLKLFTTLVARRQAVKEMMKAEIEMLQVKGWNPIKKTFSPVKSGYLIAPDTYWITALEQAKERLKVVPHTLKCIDTAIGYMRKAADGLGLRMSIGEIRRKELVACLRWNQDNNKRFGSPSYNRTVAYLSTLFSELLEVEAVEYNYLRDIKKLPEQARKMVLLTDKEIEKIHDELPKLNYNLYRYINIFFQSGRRTTELFSVKIKDVDLEKREYKCRTLKGGMRDLICPITEYALPFWEQLTGEPEWYVFGDGLIPGPKKAAKGAYSDRFEKWVQGRLGIDKPANVFRHLFATRLSKKKGMEKAAEFTQHKGSGMMRKVYNVEAERQALEKSKKVKVVF